MNTAVNNIKKIISIKSLISVAEKNLMNTLTIKKKYVTVRMIPNAPWMSPAFSSRYAVASEFLCLLQICTIKTHH